MTFVINKPKHTKLLFFSPIIESSKTRKVAFSLTQQHNGLVLPSFFVHIRISPPTPINTAEDVKKMERTTEALTAKWILTGSQLV